jgi:hypothetical protein
MKKRLFFLCCFTLHTYTMNKSLMTLEQSPLSKEIIQSYLLQLQKEPPSHHNNNFENIVKALIGKSQPKQAKIVFQTTFVDEKTLQDVSTKMLFASIDLRCLHKKMTKTTKTCAQNRIISVPDPLNCYIHNHPSV